MKFPPKCLVSGTSRETVFICLCDLYSIFESDVNEFLSRRSPGPTQKKARAACFVTCFLSRYKLTRSGLSVLYLFEHGGHRVEKVADDAVIGDVEDRRFGVLVDR